MDLTASSVEAADQFLQSANVEDSSATPCLVEPPTSEVHGDVEVPAGITSYNKEVNDVGDTRNDYDHHSLAADTGTQNDNATSTAVEKVLSADIVEMAAVLISPSVEKNITNAKSVVTRATASIECLHNDVTSGQIEDYETNLETASSHSSVGIPASQKYGGAGTSQVSLFLHCV